MNKRITRAFLLLLLLGSIVASGCRSPSAYIEQADKAADSVINEYQEKALGKKEDFTIERPADSLRRRLMIDQDLPGYTNNIVATNHPTKLPDPLQLTLMEALQIGARNSREYQSQKESVFKTALDLDLTRDNYRNSYSALLTSLFSSDSDDGEETQTLSEKLSIGFSRKLKAGGKISSKIGVDLVKLLTMDKTSTFGIFADATISIPLLRGAGYDVAQEALTQAERNVMYSIWEFERYKKSFAVQIGASYLNVLEQAKQIENAKDNFDRISDTRKRLESMAEAGRVEETQVDQTYQDELSARNRVISTRQSYEKQLDSFKVTLGLPVDARIVLDEEELNIISKESLAILREEVEKDEQGRIKEAQESVKKALENRLDLRIVKWQLEDYRRKVVVAKDDLRADADLTLSASTREETIDSDDPDAGDSAVKFGDGQYGVGLDIGLPWERTAERNAYRESLIKLESAIRDLESKEDEVKRDIRDNLRDLIEAREACRIQETAVKLAGRRVESAELFLEAGRANIRDLLEAQESLVSAQDALVSAIVSYKLATLYLQRDMEVLEINEKGIWRELKK